MPTTGHARISWKREMAALACGLLIGSAWEAAHAGAMGAAARAIAGHASVTRTHRP